MNVHNKVLIYTKYWSFNDCVKMNKWLFVFGDNDVGKGIGGQAVIRNCENAIGIPTKKFPNNKLSSYYTDDEYEENCKKIITAIEKIIKKSEKYEHIIFPKNGFGTGLSNLQIKAPKTLKFINDSIEKYFGFNFKNQ